MRVVAIEGNIGAGKSTLLPRLAKRIGFTPIQEPVDDPMFRKLLKDFTENPNDSVKRIKFQMYITNKRSELFKTMPDGDYLIERSLYSDVVFCQANMLNMERPDASYLGYYYDIIDRLKDYPQVDAIVYLRTDPEIVWERMVKRNRPEEKGTDLSYIRDVHNFHEAVLPQICDKYGAQLVAANWNHFSTEEYIVRELKKIIK
jgi:deoxyadenosine/deoxycytidine kinase